MNLGRQPSLAMSFLSDLVKATATAAVPLHAAVVLCYFRRWVCDGGFPGQGQVGYCLVAEGYRAME